ncbi:MAG: hypothetical protein HUJ29_03125 [Gammaproteobacteria bacterium]|nr:hypothetical protein [Gammaproteobacteria bacterium]
MQQMFTQEQLEHIRDQAMIFQCACPAQLCVTLDAIQKLHQIQLQCMDATETDRAVHERIRESSEKTHAELEQCLKDILIMEGWDMETLEMPDDLKKQLIKQL